MNRTLNGLLKSRKFWLAVFGLGASIFFHYLPDFPTEIWLALEGLITILILSIAIEDAGKKIGDGR